MPFLNVKEGRAVSGNRKGRKLTPKMLEFIDLYLIHMNASKAITLSSYSSKNPTRHAAALMGHPLVQEEIAKRLAKRSEKAEIKAEFLIQKLLEIINDGENKTTDVLRAVELAGKSIALWKERQEISGPDGEAIRHEQNVKESVADFTSRISSLAKRNGTDNVVNFPNGSGAS